MPQFPQLWNEVIIDIFYRVFWWLHGICFIPVKRLERYLPHRKHSRYESYHHPIIFVIVIIIPALIPVSLVAWLALYRLFLSHIRADASLTLDTWHLAHLDMEVVSKCLWTLTDLKMREARQTRWVKYMLFSFSPLKTLISGFWPASDWLLFIYRNCACYSQELSKSLNKHLWALKQRPWLRTGMFTVIDIWRINANLYSIIIFLSTLLIPDPNYLTPDLHGFQE